MELPALDAGTRHKSRQTILFARANLNRRLRSTKEGVGETSGETAGQPVRQKSSRALRSLWGMTPQFPGKTTPVRSQSWRVHRRPRFF